MMMLRREKRCKHSSREERSQHVIMHHDTGLAVFAAECGRSGGGGGGGGGGGLRGREKKVGN